MHRVPRVRLRGAGTAIPVVTAVVGLAGCASAARGVINGHLAGIDDGPHGVSSEAVESTRTILPITYRDDPQHAHRRLVRVLATLPRLRVLEDAPPYLHATQTSAFWHFTDDCEFLFAPEGTIQVRAVSRVGSHDFGVNRRRIEAIRRAMEAQASETSDGGR